MTTDSSSAGLAGKGKGVIRRRSDSEARLGEAFFPQGMGRQSSTARGKCEPEDTHFIRMEEKKKGQEPENEGGVKRRRLPANSLQHLKVTNGGSPGEARTTRDLERVEWSGRLV